MRATVLAFFASLYFLSGPATAARSRFAQAAPPSAIAISAPRIYCGNDQRYADVIIYVNPSDVGRPGLLYVGAHDPTQTSARFLSGGWLDWNGSLYPIYMIQRTGLADTKVTIPLNEIPYDWTIYVGYGALTIKDEDTVQRAMEGVAKVRAKYPDRPIPSVTADHYRRVLIQEDMTRNRKYHDVSISETDWSASCSNG